MKRLFTARGSSRRIFYLYKGKAGRARLPAYFNANCIKIGAGNYFAL